MTTPLPLPSGIKFEEYIFRPVRPRDVSRMVGRRTEAADFGTPYHTLSAATVWLEDEQYDEMEAWLADVTDGGGLFLAYDVFRPRPRAYGLEPLSGTRHGGGAFDGTATLTTVTSAREVVVSNLPTSFAINRMARIGFRRSALVRSLHSVSETVVAANGVATVKFRYGLDPMFVPSGTTVDFEKPACVMMLDPNFDPPKAWNGRRVSFTAEEVFFSEPPEE